MLKVTNDIDFEVPTSNERIELMEEWLLHYEVPSFWIENGYRVDTDLYRFGTEVAGFVYEFQMHPGFESIASISKVICRNGTCIKVCLNHPDDADLVESGDFYEIQ